MALGRQIFSTHDMVLPYDPAIDQEKSDLAAFTNKQPRFSAKHVVAKPGQNLSIFTVCSLGDLQKRVLRQSGKETDSFDFLEAVFRCGVLAIKNYPIVEGDSRKEVSQPDRKERPPLGECASPEWLQSSCIAHTDVEMVGAAVWNLSEARPLS